MANEKSHSGKTPEKCQLLHNCRVYSWSCNSLCRVGQNGKSMQQMKKNNQQQSVSIYVNVTDCKQGGK